MSTVTDSHRKKPAERPSLKELLLSDSARADLKVLPRGHAKRRPKVELG